MDDKEKKPVDAPPDETPVEPDIDKGPPDNVDPTGIVDAPGKQDPPPENPQVEVTDAG